MPRIIYDRKTSVRSGIGPVCVSVENGVTIVEARDFNSVVTEGRKFLISFDTSCNVPWDFVVGLTIEVSDEPSPPLDSPELQRLQAENKALRTHIRRALNQLQAGVRED